MDEAAQTAEIVRNPPAPGASRAPCTVRLATVLAIVIPLAAAVAAAVLAWGRGFRMTDLCLLAGMYVLSALGITVGFHRLFVHRSFETFTWTKVLWAVLGSTAVQGPLFQWVGRHRLHHRHSDTPDDPHSPRHGGSGVRGLLRGFWHAHVGWFFAAHPPDLDRYVKDLKSSRALRAASALFPVWAALGLIVPAAIGGLAVGRWDGFWTGLLWGGLVRIFLVHHVTWSVNSACHLWGRRPYASRDESRDNALFGVLAMGEGWHNTHHAFPTSARHGLRWWQPDASYWVIRAMALLGLAWDLKLPSPEAQAKARRPG